LRNRVEERRTLGFLLDRLLVDAPPQRDASQADHESDQERDAPTPVCQRLGRHRRCQQCAHAEPIRMPPTAPQHAMAPIVPR